MAKEIIHIGFSKSASTFLQSIFAASDEINYVYKSKRFGLLNEDVSEITADTNKPLLESDEHIVLPQWHPQLHRTRVTRLDDLTGVFAKVNALAEQPKIIMVVRSQQGLMLSRYSQFVVGSGGKLSPDDFIRAMLGPKDGTGFYENYYGRIVDMLHERFGAENVHVIIYEDLKSSGEQLVADLNNFTGLNFRYHAPKFKSQRKGLSARGLKLLVSLNRSLVSSNQPDPARVKTRIPRSFYIFIVKLVRVFDAWFPSQKLSLTTAQSKEIVGKFSEDNKRLAEITGRDLTKMGYEITAEK